MVSPQKKSLPKTIVIAEDEVVLLKALTLELGKAGYEVICASNGEAALEVISRLKPDLVILDIIMPKLSGLEALKRLRKSTGGKKIPVIMLTNLDQEAEIKQAEKLGVLNYYLKATVSLAELVEFINTFFAQKKPIRSGASYTSKSSRS